MEALGKTLRSSFDIVEAAASLVGEDVAATNFGPLSSEIAPNLVVEVAARLDLPQVQQVRESVGAISQR